MYYSEMKLGFYTDDERLVLSDTDIALDRKPGESQLTSTKRLIQLVISEKETETIPKVDGQMIPESGLTFDELQQKNCDRSKEAYDDILHNASLSYFGNALAGEVGEVCNLIKKIERAKLVGKFDTIPVSEVGKELADIIMYASLIASKLDLSLSQWVVDKFNEVSDRIGSNVKFDIHTQRNL